MVGVQGATGLSHPYRRLYLPVPAKFILALTLAIAWTALSVWLSQRWLADLASVSNWVFALIAIGFIAYVPGFMNAFLLGTLMFDRRPPRIHPTTYPAVSVLVAAYNEASGIRDTLTSLAHQTYPGPTTRSRSRAGRSPNWTFRPTPPCACSTIRSMQARRRCSTAV
jgi:biofilm PGA synthesis N-glycosyltransferase PgaC